MENLFGCLHFINVADVDEEMESFQRKLQSVNNVLDGDEFKSTRLTEFFTQKDEDIIEVIESLFWNFVPIPLEHIATLQEIKNSGFAGLDVDSKPFQVARQRFISEIRFLTPVDLWRKLKHCKNARFDIYANYLSIDESVDWATQNQRYVGRPLFYGVNHYKKKLFLVGRPRK